MYLQLVLRAGGMPTADLASNPRYKEIGEIGLLIGGYSALGGVVGLVSGSIAKSLMPESGIDIERCIQMGGALMALFSLTVELLSRMGA